MRLTDQPVDRDPMDDPEYQKFLAETAKRCLSKYAPCGGCQAGGMCDNFDGIEDREDEEPAEPMGEDE